MIFNIFLTIQAVFHKMFEFSYRLITNIYLDFKALKYSAVTFWILGLSILLIVIAHLFSFNFFTWKPKTMKSPIEQSLEITPYKTFVDNVKFKETTPPNFLPDVRDINICDDILPELEYKHVQTRKTVDYTTSEPEALTSLKMALHMRANGKQEKALRLFQHAMALHPIQPDILNHYGEFLEEHHQDVVKANYMYTRALIACPEHSKALVNRERTLPVVQELDEKQLLSIDMKRDRLIQIPSNDPSLKRMKKEAYFQHIHHTVAIEGNTMTLAETRMVVETRMAVPGKSITEHNEIIGLETALKYINTTLVNKFGYIDIDDILQIHKRVLGHVDPIEAGTLRRSQVYVGEHSPPPPTEVMELMESFLLWMNSEAALKLHPVKHAALAHYKLVYIHPFVDGNGRTARLLMNLILMRAGYPPVIIRKQDRSIYYEYLQLANEGDIRPFIRFIAECTERTLDVYLYATEMGMYSIKALENQDGENMSGPKIIESI